jgi:predicted dehydrogenase
MQYNVAIVGAGTTVQKYHLPIYLTNNNANLAGIWDPDENQAKKTIRKYQSDINIYDQLDDLL